VALKGRRWFGENKLDSAGRSRGSTQTTWRTRGEQLAAGDWKKLHQEAIVVDGTCPLLRQPEFVDWYIEGGATAVAPTVGSAASAGETLRNLGSWLHLISHRKDLLLVKKAKDIAAAKSTGRLGLIFHFQGADPVENDLNLVDVYKEIGVGMIQLTYNVKNRVGDGCEERTDAGLSRFGVDLIKRLNEARIVVDCSHTGYRTTLEAIKYSTRPVVFSHANPRMVHGSPRNILDDQIKAVADTGGLVGMNGFPAFVAKRRKPTLDDFIDHMDYCVDLIGVDHVALGIDYYEGQHPVAPRQEALRMYRASIASGRWSAQSYPPPPYHYPSGIETPKTLPNLTKRLLERGYKAADIRKVLGENWVRVFKSVWGQ
jgi:membrane dipeptidase